MRLVLIITALGQFGCATILGHNDHRMKVTSNPPGASVFLNGTPVGHTPVEFDVPDLGTPNTVKVRAAGYEDESQRVLRKVQNVAFCNLFSFLCWGIDYLTDSMFEIKNGHLHFELVGRSQWPPAQPPPAPVATPIPVGPVQPVDVTPVEDELVPPPLVAPADDAAPLEPAPLQPLP